MEVELYNYHPWLELIFLEEICHFYLLLICKVDTVFFPKYYYSEAASVENIWNKNVYISMVRKGIYEASIRYINCRDFLHSWFNTADEKTC